METADKSVGGSFVAGAIGGAMAVVVMAVLAAVLMRRLGPRIMPRMMKRMMSGCGSEEMRACMEACGCGKASRNGADGPGDGVDP